MSANVGVFDVDMTGQEGWRCQRLEDMTNTAKWLYYTTRVLKFLVEEPIKP